jgi:HTH-type transcriptional regulator, sugar sensing transcriptional regulator
LSQEQVINTLMSFGLTRMDAQIYILLAKKGPQKAVEIGKALKMSKPQLYRSIKNLEGRGVVSATLEHPAKFSALPFEKALDLLAKAKMTKALEEAQRIQETKDDLLANWQALNISDYKDSSAKFMVVEGRNNIYSKIQQMITETKNQISTMTTVPSLIRADQFGLFEAGFEHPLKSKIKFRFLTELPEQNVPAMKTLLKGIAQANLNFEGRNPDLGLRLFPRMVIRDKDEILFFIKSRTDLSATEQDDVCLWTDCKDLVQAFTEVFEDYWHNATDIRQTISEIETGKTPQKTFYIDVAETAKKTYNETLHLAKKEIILMTSSTGLMSSWKALTSLREWRERGVSIKIMAPIITENLEAARQLSEYCEVRHVPIAFLETTLIDGRHLFQFKVPAKQVRTPHFENTFYTSEPDFVEKTKKMLNDIWKGASATSVTLLNPLTTSSISTNDSQSSVEAALETLKEKSLLISATVTESEKPLSSSTRKVSFDKPIRVKKDNKESDEKGINIARAIWGQAIIHPPIHLNIPPILIQAFRIDQSNVGEKGDNMIVNLLLQTPKGNTFVPVAIVQDNPKTGILHKAVFSGLPAGQNIKTVAEDELEVWSQGNNLFAGWTVPIPLLPLPYNLPPSSMMLEGHGSPKLRKYTVNWPSGYKTSARNNECQAFATFVNPSWRYAGPAIDGALTTDCIMITTPPEHEKKEMKID